LRTARRHLAARDVRRRRRTPALHPAPGNGGTARPRRLAWDAVLPGFRAARPPALASLPAAPCVACSVSALRSAHPGRGVGAWPQGEPARAGVSRHQARVVLPLSLPAPEGVSAATHADRRTAGHPRGGHRADAYYGRSSIAL